MTIVPGRTPCLRCVFESPPPPGTAPTCDTAGVLAPAVNLVASLQVAEALKILAGRLERINRCLASLDVWRNTWRRLEIESSRTSGDCPACHLGRYDFLEGERESSAAVLCGRDSVQINQPQGKHLDFPQLGRRLELLGSVSYNRFLLRFRLKEIEIAVFPDGRGIVKGTRDPQEARSLYSRYIGN
jgi:adenylyltransferase/sulfurtransferase